MPLFNPPDTLEPDELNDPVSFRWEMKTPWGLMAQVLTVDILITIEHPETYLKLAGELWMATIATAISRDVSLDLSWIVRWKQSPLAFPAAPPALTHGRQFHSPAGKGHCILVQQDTGHHDGLSKRLITLPGTPIGWQSGGILSRVGWDSAMVWAHALKMGLAGNEIGGNMQHLLMFPNIAEPKPENLSGVRFRRVKWLRVLQYTDKAPDFDGSLWP